MRKNELEMAILRKTRENNGSNVWSKTDGEKENRGPDGDVRIK